MYDVLKMKKADLTRKLTEGGCWKKREGGAHEIWTNGKKSTAVPRHKEINEITAMKILRQLGVET